MEGVLLTGGASRRMGEDKARLTLEGEVVSERIAHRLREVCERVTVLGREPISGCEFLPDDQEFAGPLAALSRFHPRSELIFVASCDLPRFNPRAIELLRERIGAHDVALPVYEGRVQPLCALYAADAWAALRETEASGRKSIMAWLDRLNQVQISASDFKSAGIDERAVSGANTPEEWKRLTSTD